MARMPASISQITPTLYLGNISSSLRGSALRDNNIVAIVSLVSGPYAGWNAATVRDVVPEERQLFLACQDIESMDILALLPEACDFIDMFIGDASSSKKGEGDGGSGGCVLVHCEQGMSRSATVVVAYLMRKRGLGRDKALAFVNAQRKIQPNPGFMAQLETWESNLNL